MICCAANQPDCRHLEKSAECWSCTAYGWVTIDPMMDACLDYEAPGEHDLRCVLQDMLDAMNQDIREYHEWDAQYKRWGMLGGITIVVAYVIFVVWMFT